MKGIVEVATRFLQVRKQLLDCRGTEFEQTAMGRRELLECEAEMRALAWVLDVDLELMNAPKAPAVVGDVARVEMHRVDGAWLVEVPASRDPGWRTQYWA